MWPSRQSTRAPPVQRTVGESQGIRNIAYGVPFEQFKQKSQFHPRRRSSSHRTRCYRCGEKGHRAAECRNPQICFRCTGTGHKASSCTASRPKNRIITTSNFSEPIIPPPVSQSLRSPLTHDPSSLPNPKSPPKHIASKEIASHSAIPYQHSHNTASRSHLGSISTMADKIMHHIELGGADYKKFHAELNRSFIVTMPMGMEVPDIIAGLQISHPVIGHWDISKLGDNKFLIEGPVAWVKGVIARGVCDLGPLSLPVYTAFSDLFPKLTPERYWIRLTNLPYDMRDIHTLDSIPNRFAPW